MPTTTLLKQYALFGQTTKRKLGGWGDFRLSFVNWADARTAAQLLTRNGGWAQVIDLVTGEEERMD